MRPRRWRRGPGTARCGSLPPPGCAGPACGPHGAPRPSTRTRQACAQAVRRRTWSGRTRAPGRRCAGGSGRATRSSPPRARSPPCGGCSWPGLPPSRSGRTSRRRPPRRPAASPLRAWWLKTGVSDGPPCRAARPRCGARRARSPCPSCGPPRRAPACRACQTTPRRCACDPSAARESPQRCPRRTSARVPADPWARRHTRQCWSSRCDTRSPGRRLRSARPAPAWARGRGRACSRALPARWPASGAAG